MIESIQFKKSWNDLIMRLPSEKQPIVYQSVMSYAFGGICPELDEVSAFVLNFIKDEIDKEKEQKEQLSAKRRIAGSMANGSKCKQNEQMLANDANEANDVEEAPTPNSSSPTPPTSLTTPEEEKEKLSKESQKKKGLTLEERKVAFGKSLEQYTGDGEKQFPREMVAKFYRYWTEASPGGTKMLFEKQKTFDPYLRLCNWKERDEEKQVKNNNQGKTYGDRFRTNFGTGEDDGRVRVYESTIQI